MTETWYGRTVMEEKDLSTKIKGLEAFLEKVDAAADNLGVSKENRELLREQWYVMRLYDRILQNRIFINAPGHVRKETSRNDMTKEEARRCIGTIK